MRLQVQQFNPANLKPYRIMLYVGRRGSGKSSLLRDILYRISGTVDFGLAFSPTEESLSAFREIMPEAWIYSMFSQSKLEQMLDMQRAHGRIGKQRHLFLIMDDCMYDKKIMKSTAMRDLFMNGRHLKITLCFAVQYLMDISPDLRSNIDYVFSMNEKIISNKTKLWKYFYGMFEKYEDFSRTMDRCTENFSSMVLDNTARTSNLSDTVFWYRASLDLPSFKMGKPIYWKLAEATRKTEEDRMREQRQENALRKLEQKNKDKRITCVERQDMNGNIIEEDLPGGGMQIC